MFTLVAFLHPKGAFDSSHNAIVFKLARLGLTGSPLSWVKSFSSSRSRLQTTCAQHCHTLLTDALQNTTLGHYRRDPRPHWWTHSPSRALDTALTTLRIGHTRLNHQPHTHTQINTLNTHLSSRCDLLPRSTAT